MLNESTDFQDYADFWAKKQFSRSIRIAKLYYKKSNRLTKKLKNHNWKNEAKNIEKIYHVNKAIYYKADKNLPFNTLALIGKLLGNESHHEAMKEIISTNVLSYNTHIYKLDDPEAQVKIRRALRTLDFGTVHNYAA